MLVSILLGRLLGPDGYGVYAFTIAWAGVFSVLVVFGADILSTRELARARAHSQYRKFRDILVWTTRRVAVSGLIMSVLFAVTTFTGFFTNGTRTVGTAIAWGTALVPMLAFLKLAQGQLLGANQILKSQLPIFVLAPLTLAIGVVYLTVTGRNTPSNALTVQIAAYALPLILSCVWVRSLPRSHNGIRSTRLDQRKWRNSCAMFATISGISILNDQIGVLMLGILAGGDQAGPFDIARKLSGLVAFMLLIINTPLGPLVAEYFSRDDLGSMQRAASITARTAMIAAVVVSLIFLLFGKQILGLFGSGFQESFIPLMILCLGHIVNAGCGAVALILNMTGHERYALTGLAASFTLAVLLNLVLIPDYQMLGSAIASSVAMILWNLILLVGIFRSLGINPTFLGRNMI